MKPLPEPIDVELGYNPTHLAGLGDLAQTVAQMMGKSLSDYDLNTILMQIYPQVTTRKLLLVGHSQGSFYANSMYTYLLAHGEPRAAVGVYNVATPAGSVAGGGKYLNSSGDSILSFARSLGFKFLPNNIQLVSSPEDAKGAYPGHSFSTAYLAGDPERVVGDIQSELALLEPTYASDRGECFTSPESTLGYKAQGVLFAVADPVSVGVKAGAGAVKSAAVAASNVLAAAVSGVFGVAKKVVADVGVTIGGVKGLLHAGEPASNSTNFEIVQKLYGSSLTKQEYQEYFGSQGSAVAAAPIFNPPAPAPAPAQPAAPQPPKISAPVQKSAPSVPIGPAPGISPGGGSVSPQVIVGALADEPDFYSAAVYEGTVGNSTLLFALSGPGYVPAPNASGYASEQGPVFIAVWKEADDTHASFADFNEYFTTGSRAAPHQNFAAVSWLGAATP